MILKNISILYGNDLKFIESTNVKITNKKFQNISPDIISSKEKTLDCKGLLLIPGLINSHTHVGDSIGKDVSLDSNVNSRIHPVSGVKQKILTETPKKELVKFMRKSAISMLKKGITTFVDFREGGIEGIQLLKDAVKVNPIRSIILGRIDYYQTSSDIRKNTPMPKSYQAELRSLLRNCDGVLVPGGFGDRGIEGKISAVRFARENKVPYFGICLGMHCAAIEFARHVAKLKNANSSEFSTTSPYLVIDLLPNQNIEGDKGGTMRLGEYPCQLRKNSNAYAAYGKREIEERHRHRYEFNNMYRIQMEEAGLKISGLSPTGNLVEIIELEDHPWFLAGQFHPEFKSSPMEPHPLFQDFISSSIKFQKSNHKS